MVVAEQGAAGKCLETFVDSWLFPADELTLGPAPADVYERVQRIAATAPAGSGRLLFLPWLNGAGPPSGDGRHQVRKPLNQAVEHGAQARGAW